MTRIIFLNGPPRSGKDYAGEWLNGEMPHAFVVKFAAILKERVHAIYGLESEFGITRPHDFFEDYKDEELDEFEGLTPRAAYIGFSERYIKPMHGDKQFGTWLADKIRDIADTTPQELTFIVTDSGFRGEAEVLVDSFGAENCLLARIHRDGYTFAGDSRSYIDLEDLGVQCYDLTNCGASAFHDELTRLTQTSSLD